MLHNRTATATLRTAGNLCRSHQNVAGRSPLKTEERFAGLRRVGSYRRAAAAKDRRNLLVCQKTNQARVDRFVECVALHGQRMAAGKRQAVGQFRIVQDSPAAGQTPYDRTVLAGRVLMPIAMVLEVAQRQGRPVPLIESPTAATRLGRPLKQHLVDRHIPRTGCRRIDQQATGGWSGHGNNGGCGRKWTRFCWQTRTMALRGRRIGWLLRRRPRSAIVQRIWISFQTKTRTGNPPTSRGSAFSRQPLRRAG